jgi:hypothetical protein
MYKNRTSSGYFTEKIELANSIILTSATESNIICCGKYPKSHKHTSLYGNSKREYICSFYLPHLISTRSECSYPLLPQQQRKNIKEKDIKLNAAAWSRNNYLRNSGSIF